LKALGLGSEVDIQLALTARKPNVIMVFYRLLEMRKDNQEVNNLYPSANRSNRNRSRTVNERDRESLTSPTSSLDGKTRSRSLLTNAEQQPRRHQRKSLGMGNPPLPPSPLAVTQNHHSSHHTHSSNSPQARARSNSSSSGSGSSSEGLMFALDTPLNGVQAANADSLGVEPLQLSPANTPPGSPRYRQHQRAHHSPSPHVHSPSEAVNIPSSPSPSPRDSASSVPINISDRFRRMRLATESVTPSSPPGSPIIGSNPKRSWFSNFFTGSPQISPRGETTQTYAMQTFKDGVELAAEVQRSLSALKTSWRLAKEDLYEAEYKATDGTCLKFSMEVMNGKNKQEVDIRFVVIALRDGPVHYFNFLCAQVHNEINL